MNLFILFPANVIVIEILVLTCLSISSSTTGEFQVEVNSRAKLIHIDRILGALINTGYVSSARDKAIIRALGERIASRTLLIAMLLLLNLLLSSAVLARSLAGLLSSRACPSAGGLHLVGGPSDDSGRRLRLCVARCRSRTL